MARTRFKRRWVVGAALFALAAAGWWGWSALILRRTVVERADVDEPFVRLAGGGEAQGSRLLRERAFYFDPTPLFLPTAQNFGQGRLPRSLRPQPGQVFANFPEQLNFGDRSLRAYASAPGVVAENLSEVLSRANEAPFAGLGESGAELGKATPRSAMLEVKALDGTELGHEVLSGLALPRSEFAPLEFVVAIGVAGAIGRPVLVTSSGWDEVDAFFRDYVENTYRIGARLAPGRYRVLIGP